MNNDSIVLMEYGDYQCPYSRNAEAIVLKVLRRYEGRLRLDYRHFPLRAIHPESQFAAEAAEAAREQGLFWQMHDALFQNGNRLSREVIFRCAEKIGLDMDQFQNALRARRFIQKISEDLRSGIRNKIESVPTFFINDIRYDGEIAEEPLAHAIHLQLAKQTRLRMAA